jgi:hypothetical protein
MQKKLIFFIVFSYNLPAGTLSSVLIFKDKFCVEILFFKHYFSPLNTVMKGKDPACLNQVDPDPQHCWTDTYVV